MGRASLWESAGRGEAVCKDLWEPGLGPVEGPCRPSSKPYPQKSLQCRALCERPGNPSNEVLTSPCAPLKASGPRMEGSLGPGSVRCLGPASYQLQ